MFDGDKCHGDDKVGQGKGHGECRSGGSLPIKQDGQFSLREKPRVSGEKHSRQREQHVQRPWGGNGPGVLRCSGKEKNWGWRWSRAQIRLGFLL